MEQGWKGVVSFVPGFVSTRITKGALEQRVVRYTSRPINSKLIRGPLTAEHVVKADWRAEWQRELFRDLNSSGLRLRTLKGKGGKSTRGRQLYTRKESVGETTVLVLLYSEN